MSRIKNIKVIQEFTNNNITHGVYTLMFREDSLVFIRNGDSIGVVSYFRNRPANECVSIITDDLKQEFLYLLEQKKQVVCIENELSED